MELRVGGTGSSGNAYSLEYNGQILLLDAGLCHKDIKRMIDWRVGDIVGCIITHEHKDHSKSADKLETMGIRVYRPYLIDRKHLRTTIGDFKITSFDLPHNGTDNRGFIIEAGTERVLYMTDYEYCPYCLKDKNITTMLIECNYDKELLDDDCNHLKHICLGHAELNTVVNFIHINITDNLKHIILCHMSGSGNLDKSKALEIIEETVKDQNVTVRFASPGLKVEL